MITVSENSIIETRVVGDGSQVDDFCYVGPEVRIGDNVHVYPHTVLSGNLYIGDGTRIYPGSFIGKEPDGAGVLSREPSYVNRIIIGRDCAIGPYTTIYLDVEIENNVLIGDYASIRENCRIGKGCVIGRFVSLNYNVRTGESVKIMDHSWLAGNMIVEDHVFIGGGVMTSNDNQMHTRKYDEGRVKGPHIMSHASIGSGSVILPAIRIGSHSTVAAGSVVTKDVPDNALVLGVPAKVRKKE